MIRQFKWELLSIFLLFILALFIFRSVLLNLSTNLLDWNDYPYYVWTVSQNVEHIKNFSINNFFNTNIFYQYQGSLLFSDLLFPASIISYILSFLIVNPITNFNIIFFINFFLNIIAIYFFWKKIFESKILIFWGTLTTAFSPFVILFVNHFQMITLWPLFFGLSNLFTQKYRTRNFLILGLWCSIQFWASVYLSIFMLFSIGIWFILKFLYESNNKSARLLLLKSALVFTATYVILAGPLFLKYNQVKNAYQITRDYGEYVLYAAEPTDYLFSNYYRSILSSSTLFTKWDSFNKHMIGESAGFPSMIILTLAIFGFFSFAKIKSKRVIGFESSFNNYFFLILLVVGLIFSLGPRLSVNGIYAGIPLPYHLALRLIPILEPIRATGRWMIFFYLGLIYFSLVGFKKFGDIYNKQLLLGIVFVLIYIIEIIPVYYNFEAKDYYPNSYEIIAKSCNIQPIVLLEYPMTQFKANSNIVTNLSYRTQMMLASVNHHCILVNGYSGYIPTDYQRFENELFTSVEKQNFPNFLNLMIEKQVSLIKINKDELYESSVLKITKLLDNYPNSQIIFNDTHYLIFKIRNDK